MKLFDQFFTGINSYKEAHKFIVKHKLWLFVFLPGLINLLLAIGTYILIIKLKISDYFDITSFDWGWFNWLFKAFGFIIELIRILIFVIIYLFIYKNIVLILMSPILAFLVDKVDEINSAVKFTFSFSQLFKDFIRGLRITTRNIGLELSFMIFLFFIGMIPVLCIFSPFILLIIQWFYLGFGMIDFTNERRRLNYHERVLYCRKNKGLAVSIGLIFTLILLIPVLGVMIAPAYAATAANLGINKLQK